MMVHRIATPCGLVPACCGPPTYHQFSSESQRHVMATGLSTILCSFPSRPILGNDTIDNFMQSSVAPYLGQRHSRQFFHWSCDTPATPRLGTSPCRDADGMPMTTITITMTITGSTLWTLKRRMRRSQCRLHRRSASLPSCAA